VLHTREPASFYRSAVLPIKNVRRIFSELPCRGNIALKRELCGFEPLLISGGNVSQDLFVGFPAFRKCREVPRMGPSDVQIDEKAVGDQKLHKLAFCLPVLVEKESGRKAG